MVGADISRATTPGTSWQASNGSINNIEDAKLSRSRPRTFPYHECLPYDVETQAKRVADLEVCIKNLYIAVKAGDFAPGAVHWTREIRGWLSLKFDLPLDVRIKLIHLYYDLALAPGLNVTVAERFASMFMVLTKRKHYVRPGKDLLLDWRPLFKEIKPFVFPPEVQILDNKRAIRTLTKLCTFAQLYFDPKEIPAMFEEFLPYFSTSFNENAYVVVGLLNLMLPTSPPPEDRPDLLPQQYLPTFFHLWSLVNRSKIFDIHFIDVFSRLARDSLLGSHIPFSQHGIFTAEQSSVIFTAILRLLEIPVGQSTSPYSSAVDMGAGLALMLERDRQKHPVAHHIARWVVMSLSPSSAETPDSMLVKLESLIQAVETFYHPSNSGSWTATLSQLVYYLADFFVMRWNREHSGEMKVPEDRRLNAAVKRRFVRCLREVIFMGIFAKSGTAMNFSMSTLQNLAYLEPSLILPGALQRIYPAIQGLVEVHRTISAIRALQVLSKTMARTKGFRCHITSLLGLALPGIDANDLEKTLHTLAFIQAVCYNVPLHDLTQESKPASAKDESRSGATTPLEHESADTGLAMHWITEQVERMEKEGRTMEFDYDQELTDHEEAMILKSSTTGLSEFIISFLGRVFALLENLPDASRVRSGSPEENIVNTLPATFTPLLAALSPDLYEIALNKIADFVTNHVIHQARDAIAFICNSLVKINPKKALERLLPSLIAGIRTEIDDNGAGSTRTTGSEVLPRDRALVWNISLISMCVVHVGSDVMRWKKELFDIATHMQDRCRGIPTVHVSNFIHHLLLNLTVTYTADYSIYEKSDVERGLTTSDWGKIVDPKKLNIFWHTPSEDEMSFAVELFECQIKGAIKQLTALTSNDSPIKRDGTGKDWSDEVSRNLVLVRLVLSGMSNFFDSKYRPDERDTAAGEDIEMANAADEEEDIDDSNLGDMDGEEDRIDFQYPTGYRLQRDDPRYKTIHQLRYETGETLHRIHQFLIERQEDDVQCFNALYNAYRAWFVDVGIERSAQVLDRVIRLLQADVHQFRASGLRKEYPRPLLVRRAFVYHLQRLRHNATPRPKTELEKALLLDLSQSSVSLYTEIRRTAQSANESANKCIIGARPLVIPPLLEALEKALKEQDYPRIKGGVFSLLFGSLAKTISGNWRFAPKLVKLFIEVTGADKPSVQKLSSNATFQVMDMCRALERMVVLNPDVVEGISYSVAKEEKDDVMATIDRKRKTIKKKRKRVEEKKAHLSEELVDIAREAHWKSASRTAAIVCNLGTRFDSIACKGLIDLVTKGSIDTHPSLRGLYSGALVGIFTVIHTRSLCKHSYEKYILRTEELPDKVMVPTRRYDPEWTKEYLGSFSRPDANYYVDYDYPGWLVWNDTMPAFTTKVGDMDYDEVELGARKMIAKIMDRDWFSSFFAFMKQEPRDSSSDRFRMSSALVLTHAFELVFAGLSSATFDDIKELAESVWGDGSDKHQHRATAEIMSALLNCAPDLDPELRSKVWTYVFPRVRGIFQDELTPENTTYWSSFLRVTLQGKDPRRAWPLVNWLAEFRLDMSSNAAFKQSSKINMLQQTVLDLGWHFQLETPILEDFMNHLDHPYKGVREAIGQTLASIYRTRYHESYPDIKSLMEAQRSASSLGVRPYAPTSKFTEMMKAVFDRLEVWRKEHPPGQQTPSSYTQGSKTMLLWLDNTLCGQDCIQLVPFFPDPLMEQLLHMMDIKEDRELQSLAYHVFRHLPNIPHRGGEDQAFIDALIRIGRSSTTWHQRLRILINIQVIYFRRLFVMSEGQQQALTDCVTAMLADAQLEVRLGASTTLSGMIRCSPATFRDRTVANLKKEFTEMLAQNPLPKRRIPGTPTPEHSRLILNRHAAVLGLGSLVQAFPYQSPPPPWLPDVLATLALKASGDSGSVGKSVKSILADFKNTRQDTWHIDVKAFEPEQLEDLEGVLWKSYFA
ncbi:hypothetical protein BDY21DRAFT_281378 [Lineolata rhizophorae]|uniref:Proteasome activator subunit 4 n=1 Tax=Lineolata rhizophorae TaxID=578093 RepID=A0A6A6P8J7_9PEZI|nr:hypothetical protein BDY21DRAFT_281378 [Lineolata rhizophorae]